MAMDFNVYNRYLHDPLINVYGFLKEQELTFKSKFLFIEIIDSIVG